jgi:hypothetical protein
MLSYERRVVTAMITTPDPVIRESVVQFVGGSLGAMPEFLRAGITLITVVIGSWSGLRSLVGRTRTPAEELAWLEEHPIGLVRQWARALRSLVLFSEQEQLEAAGVPA